MNKIILSFFILALSFSNFLSYPAYSKIVLSPEGARNLKKMVQEELDWYGSLLKVTGHTLKLGGATIVTPKNDYYEIKFPKVSLSLSSNQTIYIENIILNAAPGNKGKWFLKIALPKRMAIYNNEKDVIANISIKKQKFAATWIPIKGLYPKVELLYKDIILTGTRQNPVYGSIKSIKISSKLKGHYDESWSGKDKFIIKDIKLEASGENNIDFKVKKLEISNLYDKLDSKRIFASRKIIKSILPYIGLHKIKDDSSFIINIAATIQDLANNITSKSEITGIDLNIKNNSINSKAFNISLDKITSETALKDSHKDQTRLNISNHFNGLHISSLPPELVGIVPYKGNINIKAQNIPFRKISGMILDGLKVTLNNPDIKISNILSYIPQVIKRSGTSFSIEDSKLTAVEAEATVNGRFTAVNNTTYGVSGRIDLNIKGLENINKRLEEIATNPKSSTRTSLYAGAFSTMSMIEKIRNSSNDNDGVNYSFEITDDGDVILNKINLKRFINLGKTFEKKIIKEDKKNIVK